jgi:Rrf2 family protein
MFNKETEYALRGLVYIRLQNMKKRRPGAGEITREIGAPASFTAKILQRLVRSGYLRSAKGKGGGFFFEENAPDISLADLLGATGSRAYSECAFGLKRCDENNPCPLHERYAPIRESIKLLLEDETINSLASKLYEKENPNNDQ